MHGDGRATNVARAQMREGGFEYLVARNPNA